MPHSIKFREKSNDRICVVCRELYITDVLKDSATSMMALAQNLAVAGADVTIYWIPNWNPSPEDIANTAAHFKDNYAITVVPYDHDNGLTYQNDANTHLSLGLLSYLRQQDYSAVYAPLEDGLAYYTLLGRETGVFEECPKIFIIASAPTEWSFEVDRMFYWSADQLRSNFMEKYCAQDADELICMSTGLLDWMKARKWKLPKDCKVLPALLPKEWNEQPAPEVFHQPQMAREIVLIANPRFRDGMTLFCDALDQLSGTVDESLTVTIPGSFYRMLGEHTGGMFVRRGRRWKFRLRFLPNLNLRQSLIYAKQVGAVAVIPSFENGSGYGVAECIRLGVPFVATNVGGNLTQAKFADVMDCLAAPRPKDIASLVAAKIRRPVAPRPRKFEIEKFASWLKVLSAASKPAAIGRRKRAAKSSAPLVSVIMPHHDRAQYFLQALESVRQQDYPNFEVIVIDDGSALPESHAMLDGLKAEFKKRKWKIIKTENRYVGAARNTGIRASRGEFVIFVDDDNGLMPGAITTYVKAIVHSDADACSAFARNFYGRHVPASTRFNYLGWTPLGASPDICFFENVIGDTCAIYRKTIFDKVGYQIEKFGYMVEDYEFFSRIMLAGLKIRVIPEPLFWYRISTQGRYRSSHYYDNHLPILEAFSKAKFAGMDDLYKLVLGQNIPTYAKNMYKANLTYSPSDSGFLELCELEPNGPEAVALLARLAAAESRADTAVGLLAALGTRNFDSRLEALLEANGSPANVALGQIPVFTSTRTVGVSELMNMQVVSERAEAAAPKSYVEPPGHLFLEAGGKAISVAVLPAGVPAHTTAVTCSISASGSAKAGMEFLMLLLPMHADPVAAVQAAVHGRAEASSGWLSTGPSGIPAELSVLAASPSPVPCNLVLALRSYLPEAEFATGRFGPIKMQTALEDKVGRPRLGAPPQGTRGRAWTDAERRSAKLVTNYQSELPLILFPKDANEGIFLRPSDEGPVVAAIYAGFPAFAQELLAQVEIANDEASPFEFAVALSIPGADLTWRAGGPKNAAAFSGWVRVEEKFKLIDISLRLHEKMGEALTITLAVRVPRGSSAAPANAFWRSLKFLWED